MKRARGIKQLSTVTPSQDNKQGVTNQQAWGGLGQPAQSACPHCGYCPHCGRGGYFAPYIQPYWGSPWTVTCGDVPTGTGTMTVY